MQDKTREQLTDELNEIRPSMIELDPTTSPKSSKPDLPDNVLTQWQGISDLMAITCGVPSGLIMKVHPGEIEVLVSAKVNNNPYHPGEKASLSTGLYCETVISTRNRLLVPNALKDPNWDHNPDIPLGMISYLGYPLLWPDDDIFGTICILDNKENSYSVQIDEYVKLFRGNIENYLALLFEVNQHKLAKAALRQEQVFTSALLENLLEGIVACDADGTLILFNKMSREWHGLDPIAIPQEQWADYYNLYCADGVTPMTVATVPLLRAFQGAELRNEGMVIRAKGQPDRHILANCAPFFDENGTKLGAVGVMHDITERKRLEQEKENLIVELQKALSEVKQLSRFLPICSSCKKIRDDKGYWNEVETYISDHSDTQFSHGICPDCIRKLYPEIADEMFGTSKE